MDRHDNGYGIGKKSPRKTLILVARCKPIIITLTFCEGLLNGFALEDRRRRVRLKLDAPYVELARFIAGIKLEL